MEDFVAEIYEYAQLIPATKEIIEKCLCDDRFHVKQMWGEISELYTSFCKHLSTTDPVLAGSIFSKLTEACNYTTSEGQNYNSMADSLNDVIELMYIAMGKESNIDVTDGIYRFFSSRSGYLSLENMKSRKKYHSSLDPVNEALILARRLYDPKFTTFKFLGCGLGYLPWQIFCLSDLSTDIYIYHNDPRLIDYAFRFGVLGLIPENKLHIEIYEDENKLIKEYISDADIKGATGFKTLQDVKDSLSENIQRSVSLFDLNNDTRSIYSDYIDINLHRNIKNVSKLYSDFKPFYNNKVWIMAVAGPSLDCELDYIKQNCGKKPIICASTVLKKLIDYGIRPDCVAVLDPLSRTFRHFEGITDETIPLIMNSTANWQFSEYYMGAKYLVPSATSEISILYWKSQNVQTLEVGSTVSSMILNTLTAMGVKEIEMAGLDLSYPTGMSHASGTMDLKDVSSKATVEVKSVSGGKVRTSPQFLFYINEIEKIIKNNPSVRFINRSKIGADFEGSLKV